MKKTKPKPDDYSFHEALDRTHVVLCMIDDHLLDHPVIADNERLRRKAEKASKNLADLYQLIGDEHLK